MSTTAQTEDALLAALKTIRTDWDALVESVEGGQSSGSAASTDVVTSLDKLISLRHEVHLCLNGWARVIVEDRPVTKAMPDGRDTIGLIDFIERHANWFSGHEAAQDAADEIAEWAEKVHAIAAPKVREHIHLGHCPFIVGEPDALRFCAGSVRVKIGGDGFGVCSDCEQEGLIEWWEDVLSIDSIPKGLVTAQAIADLLLTRLHMRVSYRTVLNWARADRITMHVAFGPQPEQRRFTTKSVFDARMVIDEATRLWRECPMCGLLWQGVGDICSRCYAASQVAQTRYAEPKEIYPVRFVSRPKVVPVPRDDTRPQRCPYSDLPTQMCACGHAGHVSA